MLAKGFRRVRKPNYTREETEILLDQLLTYGNYLFGKAQPGINNQQRADVWANIAAMVNAVPNSAGRTVEELKHRWQDLAQRARAALRRNSDDRHQLLQKQMPYMDKVLRIMGEVRPETIPSKESHSPTPSTDTSDADISTKIEIKQEKVETSKESPVILNQTINPLKRMLTPLKTPSLKRFRDANSYDSSIGSALPNYNQNGVSSLVTARLPFDHGTVPDSLEHPVLPAEVEDRKSSSIYFPPQRHSEPRPMVMDPESQLIMEVDLMEEESRRSPSVEVNNEDEIYNKRSASAEADFPSAPENTHGKISNSVAENGKFECNDIHGDPHAQQMRAKLKSTQATSYGSAYNCQSSRLVNEMTNPWDTSHLEAMSTHQLERISLISKIRLQNQQRSYVKLKEEKLRLEMELLKTKNFSSLLKSMGSAAAHALFFPQSTPHNSGDCLHAPDLIQNSASEFEEASECNDHKEKEEDEEIEGKSREENYVEDGEENEDVHESSSSETDHDSQGDLEDKDFELENDRTGDVEVNDNEFSPNQNGEKD